MVRLLEVKLIKVEADSLTESFCNFYLSGLIILTIQQLSNHSSGFPILALFCGFQIQLDMILCITFLSSNFITSGLPCDSLGLWI
jgi:hypothetical protein